MDLLTSVLYSEIFLSPPIKAMYAPAYAGAAVAEAKAKAKASMAKYLASLVKREEEGWTVLAAEVPSSPARMSWSRPPLSQPSARQRMS